MKKPVKEYKYEVLITNCYEGILEGDAEIFRKLSKAKQFVEEHFFERNYSNRRVSNSILKYEVLPNDDIKYINKIWVFKNKEWYSKREIIWR